ncbi:DUF1835 domain-containing protein [Bacillus sp. AK128]
MYKIVTLDYLTVSDMTENGEWQTFELDHEDEFNAFNHEENKALEGRGYFLNQDYLNMMVEETNKHIQKYRKLHIVTESSDDVVYKTGAVHIVASESAAGTLRVGLEIPKQVIGLPDSLSIGPLWKLDENVGQTFRNEWIYEHINYEQDDNEYENKFFNILREIEDIPHQVPIYLWYGDNADEQIGLRFLLYILRGKTNEMIILNSTELYKKYIIPNVGCPEIFHTSQIEPKDIRSLFEKNKEKHPLSEQERTQFHIEWKSLSQTKGTLHLWKNKKIIGVDENHYDLLILNTIKMLHDEQERKDFIKVGMLIGEILTDINSLINAYYLEYRIRHLIYSGVLELKGIPKSMRHYSVKLR